MIAAGLDDPKIAATLDRLYEKARGDRWVFARALPQLAFAFFTGRRVSEVMPGLLSHAYLPITREQGEMLYLAARAIRARTLVEFGTSFGISSIFLAAAARANGGRFYGTEKEPAKIAAARANLGEAGLAEVSDVLAGDALETLRTLAGPVDLVLLDGWKDLYLPVLELLLPKLSPGALVFADNIFTFKKTLAPYVAHMRDRRNGFESTTLPIGHGMEMSICI